jgi:hypothetical protein
VTPRDTEVTSAVGDRGDSLKDLEDLCYLLVSYSISLFFSLYVPCNERAVER